MTYYNVGDKVTSSSAFVSPIGTFFPKGSTFTVRLGGETGGRSIQLIADQCGSVVWISDGLFLVDETRTLAWHNSRVGC